MHLARILAFAVMAPLFAGQARAAEDAEDWKVIGGMLSLVQQIVHLAATSPDPAAAQKGIDGMLAGENPEANRLAGRFLRDVFEDVPAEQRGVIAAIGRDVLVLARREQARAAAARATEPVARMDALQARKELHAMGLRYWDEQQFLDAVRRGDRIAVDLFVAARGLESRRSD